MSHEASGRRGLILEDIVLRHQRVRFPLTEGTISFAFKQALSEDPCA